MEEHTIRAKFVALHPVMDERVTRLWAGGGRGVGGRRDRDRRTRDGALAHDDPRRSGGASRGRGRGRRRGGAAAGRRPSAHRGRDARDRAGVGSAGRNRDPGRSRVPVAVDVEEYPAPRRGTGDQGYPPSARRKLGSSCTRAGTASRRRRRRWRGRRTRTATINSSISTTGSTRSRRGAHP